MPNEYLLMVLLSYLVGSIPVALLHRKFRACGLLDRGPFGIVNDAIARIMHPVLKQLPAPWAQTVLEKWPVVTGNFLKGLLPVLLVKAVIGSDASMVAAGVLAIWGHTWPVFLGFRSERGTSAILGASFMIVPVSTAIWCACWLLFFAATRYAAMSSVLSFALFPLVLWWRKGRDLFVVFGIICAITALAQLVADLHRIIMGRSKPADEGGALTEGDIEDEEEEKEPPVRQGRLKARVALGLIAFLLAAFWFGNKYVYRGFGLQVPVIRAGGPYYKTTALTFDDGPDPLYTPLILDVLKKNGVKATFFLVGKHVERYPDIARRIVAEGHEIGSHSYSHPNMVLLSEERMIAEITKAEQAIVKATGTRPYLFRPPRGLYNAMLMKHLLRNKYTMVLWTLSSRDWQEPSYKEIAWRITTGVKPGSILLFHDSGSIISPDGGNRQCTVSALPIIINELREKGYRFVTLSEMIILSDLNGIVQ